MKIVFLLVASMLTVTSAKSQVPDSTTLTAPPKHIPGNISIVVTQNVSGKPDSVTILSTGQVVTNSYAPLATAIRMASPGDVIGFEGSTDQEVKIGYPKNSNNPLAIDAGVHHGFWLNSSNNTFDVIRDLAIVPLDPSNPPVFRGGLTFLGNISQPGMGGVDGITIQGPAVVLNYNSNANISTPDSASLGLIRLYNLELKAEVPGLHAGYFDTNWGIRGNGEATWDIRDFRCPKTKEHCLYLDNIGWDHEPGINNRFNFFTRIKVEESGRTCIQLVNRKFGGIYAGSPHSSKGPVLIEKMDCRVGQNYDGGYAVSIYGHPDIVVLRQNKILTLHGGIKIGSDYHKGVHLNENGYTTTFVRLENNRIMNFSPYLGGKPSYDVGGTERFVFMGNHETIQFFKPVCMDFNNMFGVDDPNGSFHFYTNLGPSSSLATYSGWNNCQVKVRNELSVLSSSQLNAVWSSAP